MVANKFGNLDKDRLGKEVADKELRGPGKDVAVSAMIGGVGNGNTPDQTDDTNKGQNRGSAVRDKGVQRDSIPPYKEGGFRNRAMEHKRG